MKTALSLSALFFVLSPPAASALEIENTTAGHYAWVELGDNWYASAAFGPVYLDGESGDGAWGWSGGLHSWMYFYNGGPDEDWRFIYNHKWRSWFTTIAQGERAIFPLLYLFSYTPEVNTAIRSGALWEGAIEDDGWVYIIRTFESGSAPSQAYASIMQTASRAATEVLRLFTAKLTNADDPVDADAISQAMTGMHQALDQSVLGITQALSQSMDPNQTDPSHSKQVAHGYASAYRLLVKNSLILADNSDLSRQQAIAQSLTGMSQALSQAYVGATQALAQGYAGLQDARQAGLSAEILTPLEVDFRIMTESYTLTYGVEAAGFTESIDYDSVGTLTAEALLAFTQAASQSYLGANQSAAQSYLGLTQALFETAGDVSD